MTPIGKEITYVRSDIAVVFYDEYAHGGLSLTRKSEDAENSGRNSFRIGGPSEKKMAQGGAIGGTHLAWAKSYCPDYRNLPVT
jgi:hypothetical protein